MMLFETTILGEPIGEGRPRAVKRGARVGVHAAPRSAEWRALAAAQIAHDWGQAPHEAVVRCHLTAYMPRPKTRPRVVDKVVWLAGRSFHRPAKPDVDNIAKAALDALVQGGLLRDDCQVVSLTIVRLTCGVADSPHLAILVAS